MKKQLADDIYVKCDILTGRVYRCLTALFQDFLDIQMSDIYGEQWIKEIMRLSEDILNNSNTNFKNNTLISLIDKKKEFGLETLDKTCIDVTLANTLILYNCYYLTAVPHYVPPRGKMIQILSEFNDGAHKDLTKKDDEELDRLLYNDVKKDILLLRKIQPEKSKIKDDTFFKIVGDLVQDKNKLNSHMSKVDSPDASDLLIMKMESDLKRFLNYLNASWKSSQRNAFVEKFTRQTEIIEYLRYCDDFKSVVEAINGLIAKLPRESAGGAPHKGEDTAKEPVGGTEQEPLPADELITSDDSGFKEAVRKLGRREGVPGAVEILTQYHDSLQTPYASIMLAFIYMNGWSEGHTAAEILTVASLISDPDEWLSEAEKFKGTEREKAMAYYIGHSMINSGDDSGYVMAGYLGVRLLNFELTKICFKLGGRSNATAKMYYEAFSSLPDEEAFIKNAKRLNER